MSEESMADRPWDDEVITAPVAAQEKGVAPVSVYKAIRDGRLKATRSGKAYLIRRRDLDEWKVVGHRPSRATSAAPAAAREVRGISEEQWKDRAERVIQLLDEWAADESGYDEETWPLIKKALDRDRLSSRKLFPESD